MSKLERNLFQAFVCHCESYVEFGAGGSTALAADYVKERIFAIDSCPQWLDTVREECINKPVQPNLIFVDLGPTREWGFPCDPNTRARWPTYHESIWTIEETANADLFMVDGRFRVACFAQIVLHCRPDALICFHDFASRPPYHGVYNIAREIASAEDLSVFTPKQNARTRALEMLEEFRYAPA